MMRVELIPANTRDHLVLKISILLLKIAIGVRLHVACSEKEIDFVRENLCVPPCGV